jgi:hypothetical protein
VDACIRIADVSCATGFDLEKVVVRLVNSDGLRAVVRGQPINEYAKAVGQSADFMATMADVISMHGQSVGSSVVRGPKLPPMHEEQDGGLIGWGPWAACVWCVCAGYVAAVGEDFERLVARKSDFNRTRSHRHGGKKI